MKLANKNLYKLFKDAGLDLSALTLRRLIEIITVYLTWIHLFMDTWQMTVYCLEEIINFYQLIMLWIIAMIVETEAIMLWIGAMIVGKS